MSKIKIIAYATRNGKEPFVSWKNKLDKLAQANVIRRLDRISEGNFGDAKTIKGGSGIWELRINHGPGYRIYFGKDGGSIVILLAGGDKKTQTKDIAKAKQYWLEYKEIK